jgi:hypothetical protein
MLSRPRDERRIGLAQAIYALTVIVTIPAVMLIEAGTLPRARSIRRPPTLEFGPDFRPMRFRPMPHGPKMDLPAIIRPSLEVTPLKP